MKEYKLTVIGGLETLVDEVDYYRFKDFSWCLRGEYIVLNEKRGIKRLHRLIMGAEVGEVIDHKNGNKLDNRRNNLRKCTHQQNLWNSVISKSKKSSKYRGVFFRKDRNRFITRVILNNKIYRLGSFKNEIDAAIVYDSFAIKNYGEFAKLNFPINGGL